MSDSNYLEYISWPPLKPWWLLSRRLQYHQLDFELVAVVPDGLPSHPHGVDSFYPSYYAYSYAYYPCWTCPYCRNPVLKSKKIKLTFSDFLHFVVRGKIPNWVKEATYHPKSTASSSLNFISSLVFPDLELGAPSEVNPSKLGSSFLSPWPPFWWSM